jgi:hypothetical protein
MNWFKENTFLGVLIVVTSAFAALLIYAGLSTATKRDANAEEVAARKASIKKMKSMTPYPTIESVAEKKANLQAVVAKAEAMQAQFNSFRPENLGNITVSTFSDRLKKSDAEVRALFEEKNVSMPEKAYLGFEQYKGGLPKDGATGILAYELSAIDWLFRELAAAGISKVGNFTRDVLPPEEGRDWGKSGASAKGGRATRPKRGSSKGKSAGRSAKPSLPTVEVAKRLPMALTIEGPEPSIRKVIEAIANSDQFFFDARIARIKNNAGVPSSQGIKKAEPIADEAPIVDDEFGVVEGDDGGDEPVPEAPLGSSEVLQRVSGGNDVAAYIRLDLLLFDESLKFPAIK